MKNYAKANNIKYYDFNLCRKEILDMEDDDFMDYHHLSGKGALKYSIAFAKVMTVYGEEERKELFYDSVQEKMDDLPPQTMGIILQKLTDTENVYSIKTMANYDVDVEYRICILNELGEESELIQDFSDKNILNYPLNGEITFKITHVIKTGEVCEEELITL